MDLAASFPMTLAAEAVLWLRAAVARRLGPTDLRTSGPPDWPEVAEAARRHNLEPLLFDLTESGPVSVPVEVRETWESQYYRNQIFNLSLWETAGAFLEVVGRAGIHPVVLKGPVSVARRLKDPGLRVMVDVDLLCRQPELEVLAAAAVGLGFRAVGENATYHLSFQHPELGAGLELHFDLYEVLARRSEFVEEVFTGCERLDLEGVTFRAPSPAADVVLQLAHILHHDQRLDLRHWLDFALAATEARDESELERLLRLTDLEPEFGENLAVASRLFGVETGSTAGDVEPEILAAVEECLLDLTDTRAFLSGARMYPGWWSRADYVLRLLVPSPRRWRALAVAEGTGMGTALFRHVIRAARRGRIKLARRDETAPPLNSPRARLFERRKREKGVSRSASRPALP